MSMGRDRREPNDRSDVGNSAPKGSGSPGKNSLTSSMGYSVTPTSPGNHSTSSALFGSALVVQRKVDPHAGAPKPAAGSDAAVIVDDDVVPTSLQIQRSEFFVKIEQVIKATASDVLGPSWSVADCPYIDRYLSMYAARPVRDTEQFIRRYTGSNAREATQLITDLAGRVRAGVEQWKDTGQLPSDVAAVDPGAATQASATRKPTANAVQHKAAAGAGGASGGTPDHVMAALGDGAPLEGGVATRMGDAFDTRFAGVRIHADERGGAMAQQQGALAFTVGQHVAFAPGRYTPGTVEGDALLAHELTHVLQQRGETKSGGSGHGGAEADADRGAATAVKRLHSGSSETAAATQAAGYQLQRCSGGDVDKGTIATSFKGGFEGKQIGAERSRISFGPTITTPIRAARTLGAFDSEAAAVAAVKTNGRAGAVTVESGKFVAYEADKALGWREEDVSANGTYMHFSPPDFSPGVIAMVSTSLVTLHAGQFDPSRTAVAASSAGQAMSSTEDPFAGYRQALGGDKGDLGKVDDNTLVAAFDAALRDTALVVLNKSKQQVDAKQARFANNGAGVSPTELDAMKTTAAMLAEDDAQIDASNSRLRELRIVGAMASAADEMGTANPFSDEIAAAQATRARLQATRKVHLARYPLLSRVDPAKFKDLSKEQMASQLGGELPGILADIEKTKQNVAAGNINLWEVGQVVDATIAGFGLDADKRKVIEDKRKQKATEKTVEQVVFTVFAIGFGIAAMITTGGAALVFAAGAFGLSTYDAMKQTDQYLVDKPASDVAEDKDGGFSAPPGWGWLVVAWVGVGLDAGQVGSVVAKIAKGESIAAGAAELARNAEKLGMKQDELLAKLRQVAGNVDVATQITEANKLVAAGRLGIAIEIDKNLAGDVRIYYELDKATGKVIVRGMAVGPEAKLVDVLAHENVLGLMRRYEGLTGKLNELWEKLLSIAGKSPKAKNPFPAGSRAWESWFELQKMPDLIAARTLKYGDGLKNGVKAANESALANDIDFLASETRRHEATITELALEKGDGFIAQTGDSTQAALKQHYPMPEGCTTAQEMLDKGYFYRTSVSGDGTFELARKADSTAPALRVEFEGGKPVRLVPGGEMSRAEAAAAIIKRFPDAKQRAFETLRQAQEALGNKIVPIEGIATTDKSIAKLISEFGPDNFRQRMIDILTQAYERKGDVDAAKKAIAAADALMTHPIVVIRGTDQLRAFGYRAAYLRGAGVAAEELDDLHHLIPLYLGGDHVRLIDVAEDLHARLHALIDEVYWDKSGVSLAPSSIQRAPLNFTEGAAILYPDGTVSYNTLTGAAK